MTEAKKPASPPQPTTPPTDVEPVDAAAWEAQRQDYEAEIVRLHERIALMESERAQTAANDMGVGGRVAITRLRDTDFPELAKTVEDIPEVFREDGALAALAYCRGPVRAAVDAIAFAQPRTPALAQQLHRIHMMLTEGQVELMYRDDSIGVRARIDFMEAVERCVFSESVKAAFARGTETPAGILPATYQPR